MWNEYNDDLGVLRVLVYPVVNSDGKTTRDGRQASSYHRHICRVHYYNVYKGEHLSCYTSNCENINVWPSKRQSDLYAILFTFVVIHC